jgi:hypothetical protein
MKLFAQESLGRPDLEIQNEIEHLARYLKARMSEEELPEIQGALIFTNDSVEIAVDEDDTPPAPTLYLSKLKEFLRKTAKNKPVSLDKVMEIQQILGADS